jgi:hypothetical protein
VLRVKGREHPDSVTPVGIAPSVTAGERRIRTAVRRRAWEGTQDS